MKSSVWIWSKGNFWRHTSPMRRKSLYASPCVCVCLRACTCAHESVFLLLDASCLGFGPLVRMRACMCFYVFLCVCMCVYMCHHSYLLFGGEFLQSPVGYITSFCYTLPLLPPPPPNTCTSKYCVSRSVWASLFFFFFVFSVAVPYALLMATLNALYLYVLCYCGVSTCT